jgi:hypothetical protein
VDLPEDEEREDLDRVDDLEDDLLREDRVADFFEDFDEDLDRYFPLVEDDLERYFVREMVGDLVVEDLYLLFTSLLLYFVVEMPDLPVLMRFEYLNAFFREESFVLVYLYTAPFFCL